MKYFILILLTALIFCGCSEKSKEPTVPVKKEFVNTTKTDKFSFYRIEETDQVLYDYLQEGHALLEEFFGNHFEKRFEIYVFSTRKEIESQLKMEYEDSLLKTDCGDVAFGNSLRLYILSPSTWEKQSCLKVKANPELIKKVLFKELIHVYHSQYNFSPDVCQVTEIKWFVTGLEKYFTGETIKDSTFIVKDFKGLSELNEASEENSAGQFVRFIDEKYGREKLFYLLQFSTTEQILEVLGIDEEKILRDWKRFEES